MREWSRIREREDGSGTGGRRYHVQYLQIGLYFVAMIVWKVSFVRFLITERQDDILLVTTEQIG